jgi:RHS repeat-associated protein
VFSVWSYTYDALEGLITARLNNVVRARYAYDVLGRRIVKRVYSGPNEGYLRMVYRGGVVIADADSGGALRRAYTWGLGSDDLVAIHDYVGAQDYYVGQDQLRSVRAVSRRDGTWMASFRYRIYGAVLDSAGSLSFELRYRWIGREWDAETGFYYLRARYYDPAIQRFTQEDPIGFAGGSNLFAYGEGNPTVGRDLDGLRVVVVQG